MSVLGFGGFNVGDEWKDCIHLRDLEQIHHAIVGSGDYQLGAIGLAANVMVHDQTHAG